jgi:hypothetical protein
MYEVIKRSFPHLGEKEIVKRIAQKERDFAGRTRMLIAVYDITPDNDNFYDYAILPNVNLQSVRKVQLLNSSSVELDPYEEDLAWYINGRTIFFTSWEGNQITAYSTNIATIRLEYVYIPVEYSDVSHHSDSPYVDPRFHMGLVNGVLADLYAEAKDFNGATWHKGLYEQQVIEGKKYATTDGSNLFSDVANFTL